MDDVLEEAHPVILKADARQIPLRDGCVQMVCTSPPYWGLRNYQCSGQIGLEPTPEAYVTTIVDVFREVWRVLKDDGTVWLNLGDSYNNVGGGSSFNAPLGSKSGTQRLAHQGVKQAKRWVTDLKPKDLCGIPWRVAFALQADGWYLRSDIIWSKPNPMPESVTDRPTRSHEYVFLLAKRPSYYYDAEAIKEAAVPQKRTGRPAYRCPKDEAESYIRGGLRRSFQSTLNGPSGDERNKRSVWTVTTQPYDGAHFATMPEALVEPCILAGSRFGDLVLDPFLGSGTVGVVADRLMRRWVGLDLNYHDLARARTAQRGLREISA